jgi:5-methyltetrahydrofolate--homocysteine methyltransferase
LKDQPTLIFDGACGTTLQTKTIPDSAWGTREGCNEWLNLSAPDIIQDVHADFLAAGATILETNTFGANEIVLGEYGLAEKVRELNAAGVDIARRAIEQAGKTGRAWVAGSVGPTTKLPSLGQIDVDELAESFRAQMRALIDAGCDLMMVETCQDLLQAKLAVITAREVMAETNTELPIVVSVTIEQTGTMLVGADIATAAAVLEPLDLFSLGLNCATGPKNMESHVRYLSRHWPGRFHCIPNAGLPTVENGKTCYNLSPEEYASALKRFVVEEGVSLVGGCCGTRPEHIAALSAALQDVVPAERTVDHRPQLASGYQAVDVRQEPAPLMIGERANANGSKKFREMLLADDWTGCLKVGQDQERAGAAHALDLCVAYAGRDEQQDMRTLLGMFAESIQLPVVIDSTTPEVIEDALRRYPGRAMINSINLEDGGENLHRICRLAKTYGAAVIALTIDEDGMCMTAEKKVACAKKIHQFAVEQHGLRSEDIFFDPLTFTIGSGDEHLRDAAMQTLEGIAGIKKALPGVWTVLGLSNISFGLSKASRKILNSVFLHEAVEHGMDAAIVDAGKILPLAHIAEEDRAVSLDLIYNRGGQEPSTPLHRFIEHFSEHAEHAEQDEDQTIHLPEETMTRKVIRGDREGLEDLVHILLQRHPATSIINDILIPAMRTVGEQFGRGEMLLPFVLQSAEVMKRTVDLIQPYIEKGQQEHDVKILLATVAGDVHDIGKNLVDIILSNNGYKVYNIGIKVPAETIIDKAREYDVDAIGLSGLLVKSAIMMKENMAQFSAAGLEQPILLGGAALTPKFVAEECVPQYTTGKVVYCKDAFGGLSAMRDFEQGVLEATRWTDATTAAMKPGSKVAELDRGNSVPAPPFWGVKHVTEIDPDTLWPYINEQALFRGRWGYRRGGMDKAEYEQLIAETVRPLYAQMLSRGAAEKLIQPKVAYGYFRCRANGEMVYVAHEDREWEFPFPRQAEAPHLCIADYFHTAEEGGDVAGFFVVTIGEELARLTRQLFETDEYHDYMLWHAFGVEVTDALAEYWHEVMRGEMGFGADQPASPAGYAVQDYRGSRYGFGYPACPDLDAHENLFALLRPEQIGVDLTESMEMVPEMTTSAIVVHHPQAKYFAV